MQAQGAARGGVGTIPQRGGRYLEALLTVAAILVIVALMALMTRGQWPLVRAGWEHRTPRREWARQ